MAWKSIDEWEKACETKKERIKEIYDKVTKDSNYNMFFRKGINFLDKYDGEDLEHACSFMYFAKRTLRRYNEFIAPSSDDCVKKQIDEIISYSNKISENKDAKNFHNFIDNSWKDYKTIDIKSKNIFYNFYKTIDKVESKANNNTATNLEINNNINKLQNLYSNNFEQLKKKVKSANQNLKKLGEEHGVARVQKLQRLILSEKGDFGLLYYLEKSFELIENFFTSISENLEKLDSNEKNTENYVRTVNLFCSIKKNEVKGEIETIDGFFDNDSNFTNFQNLKKSFKDSKFYKQLNSFIDFVNTNLTNIINKYFRAFIVFVQDQFEKYTVEADKNKLNSEMKYVFQYILKKINSFCSNKKKEFKEQQKKKSETIIISGKTMNQIMDLLKCIAINKFLSTDKLKPVSKKADNIIFYIGLVSAIGLFITITGILTFTTATIPFVIGLLASVCILPVSIVFGAGVAAVGTFFYKSFKALKHRKIKNKFKKILSKQEKGDDSDDASPAPTVTPMHGPETPY